MTWNYRVMHRNDEYGIVEAFYWDDGSMDWTSEFIEPIGDNPDELRECLELMLKAFDEAIMEENELL